MNNSNVSLGVLQSAMNTYYFTICLRTLIMAAGFTGNTLVVVTLLRHRGMRTVTNILLLNLSVSDLLIISVCMSFTMAVDLLQNFVFGTAGCVIIRFCQGVTIAANAFTLCAIALERFFAIVLPLRSRGFQTTRHAQKMIACIWILAALLMVPFGAFHDARALNSNSSILRCEVYAKDRIEWKLYFFLMLLVLIVLPAIFLSSAYGMILITLSRRLRFHGSERADGRSFKHKSPSRPSGSPLYPGSATPTLQRAREADCVSSNIAQSTYRTIAMLLCIVALFFICCVPNYAQQTWYMMNAVQARRVLRSYSGYILLLQNLNTCVNPVCYCFMSRSFRRHFLQVFGCGKRRPAPFGSYYPSNPLVTRQTPTRKHLVVHLMENAGALTLLDGSHAPVSVQNSHETDVD